MEVINENVEVKIETIEAPNIPVISPVQAPVKKVEKIKKQRTEAQKNQLKLAREKRKENTKKRKLVQEVVTKPMKDDNYESDEESNKRPKINEPNDMKFSLKDSSWKWLALGGVTLAAGLSTSYIKSWDEYKPKVTEKKGAQPNVPIPNVPIPRTDPFLP
jgi:hypothetical protein